MEKASGEIDLEEWEILSDDGFLDGKGLFSRESGFLPKGVVDRNYFICPSPPTRHCLQTPDNSIVPSGKNQLIPVPIRLEPMVEKNPDRELVKEIVHVPVVLEKIKDPDWVADLDPISQVFFKKMKENEFVDMKMDSPSPRSSGRGLKPQFDMGAAQFEEKEVACQSEDFEHNPPKVVIEQETGKKYMGPEMKEKRCWEGVGLNIWRWRVTGIGAFCSMGVAAAAICIFVSSSHQRHKQQHKTAAQKSEASV